MVAQLRLLALTLLAFGVFGCQDGGDAASSPSMNAPSAANGPKMDEWAKSHPDNGKSGHDDEK